MSDKCDFIARYCSADVFDDLKRLYNDYIRENQLNFSSAIERFDSIAEGAIRPEIIKKYTRKFMDEKRQDKRNARRSVDQMWRSCKGSLYEYAVCKALNEILANDSSLAQELDIIHGSKLNDIIRKQLTIVDWSEILPDVDFVIINKNCNKIMSVLSCKTSLRERLAETAFWARELKPKGIDVIFITTDKDEEITADNNRYIVMHVLDYTIITDPSRYNEIIKEWREKYGNKPDFKNMIRKVISFKDIKTILQQYKMRSSQSTCLRPNR